MPDKRWFFELNHHVTYYVDIRGGKLTLTSRVDTHDHDEQLIQVCIVRPIGTDGYGDFVFKVIYPFKRIIETVPLDQPSPNDGKHMLGGLVPIDIGPTYVVLEFSCDVGSFYGDYDYKPDTAECL